MYIYVSWCYTSEAAQADNARQEWLKKVEKSKVEEDKALALALKLENCLPEYSEYLKATANRKMIFDSLTANLLGIRFVVPALGEVQSFKLANRLPGEKKLPVAVGARNWLLNACNGEWNGNLRRSERFRVTFVGMPDLDLFLHNWALACAVYDQPLPVDLWQLTPRYELPPSTTVRELITSCAANQEDPDKAAKHKALIRGWFSSSSSAERDSAILLATAFKLGFKGV